MTDRRDVMRAAGAAGRPAPAGIEEFFRAVGKPAKAGDRSAPAPLTPADAARMAEAGKKYGVFIRE